jgi:hypothetical protein
VVVVGSRAGTRKDTFGLTQKQMVNGGEKMREFIAPSTMGDAGIARRILGATLGLGGRVFDELKTTILNDFKQEVW